VAFRSSGELLQENKANKGANKVIFFILFY